MRSKALDHEITLAGGECRVRIEIRPKVASKHLPRIPNSKGDFPDPWSCEFFLRIVNWMGDGAKAEELLEQQ